MLPGTAPSSQALPGSAQHHSAAAHHAQTVSAAARRVAQPSSPPGCAISRLGCRIGTFPGPHAALHPLRLPPVFILRPWRIGCRPGREHEESGPRLANQTPPKPGELWGQRLASDLLLPAGSAQHCPALSGNGIPLCLCCPGMGCSEGQEATMEFCPCPEAWVTQQPAGDSQPWGQSTPS